jgi:hypothetical protein
VHLRRPVGGRNNLETAAKSTVARATTLDRRASHVREKESQHLAYLWMAGHHGHRRTAVCAQPDLALLSTRVFDLDTAAEFFEHRDSSIDPPVDVAAAARSNATQSMESAYASVVVTRFAAWAHESERAMCGDLVRRGYTLDTSTRRYHARDRP